ncbi:alpha-amylase [Mucilaginibacter rubeus]|uniref:Alpha-amylase n=2 Tax=Sphingobacteriaceae TaxID=84566 RepID=A0AAE6JLT4_9SPHI|nr:alpha-amylase family glycosyl hydrolase [Mucilaginibacter rubeus]QEM20750.1 alpha-amylase [Mucilaginibacter gossypii]QEM08307.1 alpha-amylase [Mucilaginibacter rubeus]QTE47005.1 cyclomaltodextrinase C-terminal domain-containing protein [Mucilaginibacter rubeus]QTE53608.1 cyclomaltodextrinase C-terminal domain-containing protein [Mucilaginibacter rubeus]QTE57377.1 cyclomaltodextrinase C-terminal domain-containing protein [Mucilaginibacter rubeus]
MEQTTNHKLIIYQLLPRLFGNTNTLNKTNGSIEENGVGKLNDINDKALQEIKKMGFTYVWYTGVIEHATMTDYSQYGIKADDPDIVKGRAGSPYAIKDYYDIDPDLAVDVKNRIGEYEALIKRSHNNGLKVLMDLVPNHVARTYGSDVKPAGVRDFGEDDEKSKAFSPTNDFYYMPGQPFVVPSGYNPGGDEFKSLMKDGHFDENPAKATGNDVFSAAPSINDWFETIKLNYGVDYMDHRRGHFDPIPPLWNKVYDILHYWSEKGVDGFRCDMVEMVPIEFWGWVIPKLKARHPGIIFVGEAYDKGKYSDYINKGKFDYLYDKVGLYDAIKRLTRDEHNSSTWEINAVWNHDSKGIDEHMLRFMENHDEQRIASNDFAGNPWLAVPGMIVTATLNTGPVMVYFGQEVGEPAIGNEGFSGNDGRTSIFDYWGVPQHQKWVNNHKYDGAKLSADQQKLRGFYYNLLTAVHNSEALKSGAFYELMIANEHQPGFDTRLYIYARYTNNQRILVITNFNRSERKLTVKLPEDLLTKLNQSGHKQFTDLLSGAKFDTDDIRNGVEVSLPAMGGLLLEF